jgi:hypothetical protein
MQGLPWTQPAQPPGRPGRGSPFIPEDGTVRQTRERSPAGAPLDGPSRERGAGALLAVFVLATLFVMIGTGLILVQITHSGLTEQLRYHGQAVNAAQAGLVDGLAWFRRQTTQPVATFAPQRDMSASPPINETDDASIGIVRDYLVDSVGSVWGRYEVPVSAVQDVTDERGKDGTGTVWALESRGYVYVKRDGSKAFDEPPNEVISHTIGRTEIQRLAIVLPANAAINCARGDDIRTESRTRVYGGDDIAFGFPNSTGWPSASGERTGNPVSSQVDPYNGDIDDVFGVSQQELVAMADIVVSNVSELPAKLPDMTLIVIRGDATFNATNRMTGTGVLVVFGNLTVEANSYSNYNGLVYVTGNYVQRAPSQVNGSIVAGGDARILATGDFSEVFYDETILAQIQRHMGQYRFNRNQQFSAN